MIVETGHYALVLALALALVNSVLPLWGSLSAGSASDGRRAAGRGHGLWPRGLCLFRLDLCPCRLRFLARQCRRKFSFREAVDLQDHRRLGQSRRLDAFVGAGAVAVRARRSPCFRDRMPDDLRANVLAVQSWIGAAFLLFILLTSNPFARLAEAPAEGNDLNPLLQDPGLAIHPPLALSRLCRAFDHLFLRGGGLDFGPDRCGVRAFRAALDA